MVITNVPFMLEKGREMRIDSVYKNTSNLRWRPCGQYISKNPRSMDALDIITYFSKQEDILLRAVNKQMDKNNRWVSNRAEMNQTDKIRIATGIRSWIKKGLMIRLKREEYFINPHFISPLEFDQFRRIEEEWNSLNPLKR